jgi:hypothetical protein
MSLFSSSPRGCNNPPGGARAAATMPAHPTLALATRKRPAFSPLRKAGLLTLRGYLLVAAVLVVVKIVQAAGGG